VEYPNVAKIRRGLSYSSQYPTWTCDDFVEEALKLCAEAELSEKPSKMDLQLMAKLQFVEKVLNG
jgi:hypothetical protein